MAWAPIIKRLYEKEKIDSDKVDAALEQGLITEEEATEIKGDESGEG